MSTKHLLQEAYKTTKRMTACDPTTPQGARQALYDKSSFNVYIKALSEGLEGEDKENFVQICETTRLRLMENSMFQLNPYETLTMPVLRVFYPKLISKELVNVVPIDKPEVVKGFIHAYFGREDDPTGTHPHAFPSVNTDISKGPGVSVSVPGTALSPGEENIFGEIDSTGTMSLSAANAHIERDFRIIEVTDSTGYTQDVDIRPDIDGNFSEDITFEDTGMSDILQGHIDYENGMLYLSSLSDLIVSVEYVAYASLEENQINPTVRFEIEKITLSAVDRRISAEWTINMEQDAKALFDIAIQAELVNLIGEQIALDIDREIITRIIASNASLNPTSHTVQFDLTPDAGFVFGRKQWYENVIPTLNTLSAQIYNSCLMGSANTIACNPLDAAVFESLNSFEYTGDSVEGGDVGYRTATVSGGKWKILVSSIVPQGTSIVKYRSSDIQRASVVYAPYVPALLSPYPLGPIPSLTILTRYALRVIRHEAFGVLEISDTAGTGGY